MGSHVSALLKKGKLDDSEARFTETLYQPVGFAMIRAPLLSINTLQGWFAWTQRSGIISCHVQDVPKPATRTIADHEIDAQRWLQARLNEPNVQEAILVGSPDLYNAISLWRRDARGKKGRHAQTNLFRYIVRMATRPTPFGLFAGVAMGNIGPSMGVRIDSLKGNRKRTRPDMQWLLYIIRGLEQHPEVVSRLHYYTNPVSFVAGGRLYLPHVDSYGQEELEKTASLRATPIVMRALEFARYGRTLDALATQLATERPNATMDQIRHLLASLCQQGALLSELRPPLTRPDTIEYVLEKIAGLPECGSVRGQLHTVKELSAAYDETPIGSGIAVLQSLYAATNIPDAKIRSSLQVDMVSATTETTISEGVAKDACQAGCVRKLL